MHHNGYACYLVKNDDQATWIYYDGTKYFKYDNKLNVIELGDKPDVIKDHLATNEGNRKVGQSLILIQSGHKKGNDYKVEFNGNKYLSTHNVNIKQPWTIALEDVSKKDDKKEDNDEDKKDDKKDDDKDYKKEDVKKGDKNPDGFEYVYDSNEWGEHVDDKQKNKYGYGLINPNYYIDLYHQGYACYYDKRMNKWIYACVQEQQPVVMTYTYNIKKHTLEKEYEQKPNYFYFNDNMDKIYLCTATFTPKFGYSGTGDNIKSKFIGKTDGKIIVQNVKIPLAPFKDGEEIHLAKPKDIKKGGDEYAFTGGDEKTYKLKDDKPIELHKQPTNNIEIEYNICAAMINILLLNNNNIHKEEVLKNCYNLVCTKHAMMKMETSIQYMSTSDKYEKLKQWINDFVKTKFEKLTGKYFNINMYSLLRAYKHQLKIFFDKVNYLTNGITHDQNVLKSQEILDPNIKCVYDKQSQNYDIRGKQEINKLNNYLKAFEYIAFVYCNISPALLKCIAKVIYKTNLTPKEEYTISKLFNPDVENQEFENECLIDNCNSFLKSNSSLTINNNKLYYFLKRTIELKDISDESKIEFIRCKYFNFQKFLRRISNDYEHQIFMHIFENKVVNIGPDVSEQNIYKLLGKSIMNNIYNYQTYNYELQNVNNIHETINKIKTNLADKYSICEDLNGKVDDIIKTKCDSDNVCIINNTLHDIKSKFDILQFRFPYDNNSILKPILILKYIVPNDNKLDKDTLINLYKCLKIDYDSKEKKDKIKLKCDINDTALNVDNLKKLKAGWSIFNFQFSWFKFIIIILIISIVIIIIIKFAPIVSKSMFKH